MTSSYQPWEQHGFEVNVWQTLDSSAEEEK